MVDLSNGGLVYLAVCSELLLKRIVAPNRLPDTLDAAYSMAFATLDGLPERDKVHQLLAVLAAAREPLSPSDLRVLGLDTVLVVLPLWGMLFYERDVRVYLLHKTLQEYMARDTAINTMEGHRRFAMKHVVSDPGAYTLRHAVAHACQAGDAKLLEEVLLDFSMWASICRAGACFRYTYSGYGNQACDHMTHVQALCHV